MQANKKLTFKISFLAVALSWGLSFPTASAQENPKEPVQQAAVSTTASKSSAKRYFVEFRSRSALSYGHAFLVHGKLNAKGEVGQVKPHQVAGIHPFSESSIPWSIGHVVPVIAEYGWTDGDTEDEYITARYRVLLTEAQYIGVKSFINTLYKKSPLWHAVLYNCESFIGDVAQHMGLKTPPSTLVFPDEYIKILAELNGGTVKSAPTAKRTPKPASAAKGRSTTKPIASEPPSVASQTAATPAAAPARTVR